VRNYEEIWTWFQPPNSFESFTKNIMVGQGRRRGSFIPRSIHLAPTSLPGKLFVDRKTVVLGPFSRPAAAAARGGGGGGGEGGGDGGGGLTTDWLLLPKAMTSNILNSRCRCSFSRPLSSLCTTLPTATVKEPRVNTSSNQ
jgi:hypothetical protein